MIIHQLLGSSSSSQQLGLLYHQITAVLVVAASSVHTNKDDIIGIKEKVFEFPEFDYNETPKTETAWREFEAACSLNQQCLGLEELEKVRCVRKCISPSCYNEIYAFDELEEGEIDIRFPSFKGCFASRITRRRV